EDVAERAHGRGASVVTDGARLLNAVAASGVPADRWADPVDALWIDLSKGLGCPGGAVLAGSADFLDEANRWKFMLGGAMRQSGILAAAGLYALDHHVERLPEDHATAQRLAEGLADAGFAVEQPETNIVFFDSSPVGLDLEAAAAAFAERGIGVIV
ncbi:MAG: low specificity L-threonine aldolase, partial [Actinobacteria bacterium]|nr:low specificity L-threonine aldolase [Actinomycetota bacterium]NIX18418.1 low specificity L-threonine aldolase [Actinomycetota bacterium]